MLSIAQNRDRTTLNFGAKTLGITTRSIIAISITIPSIKHIQHYETAHTIMSLSIT